MIAASARTAMIETVSTLCAPPGSGWATSKLGHAPLATDFHLSSFGTTDPVQIRSRWLKSVATATGRVAVLGVPYDCGTYGLSGAAGGPLGIRAACSAHQWKQSLVDVVDLGDVPYFPGPPLDGMLADGTLEQVRRARYGAEVGRLPICMLSIHETVIRSATQAGVKVLSLGGDHSVAASSLLGLGERSFALVHVDSHSDLSQGRDGLGLLHSSWIHHVDERLKLPVVIQVGVEPQPVVPWIEGRLLSVPNLMDAAGAAHRVAERILATRLDQAYISVDIDAVDASEAPSTALPASCGLAVAELTAFIEELAARIDIIGADVVEVAPPLSGTRDWRNEQTCLSGAGVALTLLQVMANSTVATSAPQIDRSAQ